MARTKGSKNGVRKKTQPSNKNVTPFEYDLHSEVVYLGNLYDGYKHQKATVSRRSVEKGFYKWYIIKFHDEKEISVKENWIMNLEEFDNYTKDQKEREDNQ